MRIVIKYESSWRNSFLDGSNNEPLPNGGRNFIGSMTSLKKVENFIKRDVSLDTVMGILNRLIGDQRKLYRARESDKYFFKEIEPLVRFEDQPDDLHPSSEVAYIRNMTGSTDQKSFCGLLKTSDPLLTSVYSEEFWGVLWLDIDELYDFILDDKFLVSKIIQLNPLSILDRLEHIKSSKPISNEGRACEAKVELMSRFPLMKPSNPKDQILVMPLYCSALYLQLERLAAKYDMSSAKAPRGGINGISHNGFTVKNIMERFTTGGQKIIWGNPYLATPFIKGQIKVTSMLTKARGTLKIDIDIPQDQSEQLKEMIEAAGVSSFYLGKKGLAYVETIR